MKSIIITLVIFLSSPIILFGQLKGLFCHNFGSGSECINFIDSNKFEYLTNSCTGSDVGNGKYELTRSNLILRFFSDSPNAKIEKNKFDTNVHRLETILVEFRLYDIQTTEPLKFINVIFKNPGTGLKTGNTTDINGQCLLSCPILAGILTFKVFAVGYKEFSFSLQPDNNYKVNIYLHKNDGQYRIGDSLVYKITAVTKTSIKLKKGYNYSSFETYTRE